MAALAAVAAGFIATVQAALMRQTITASNDSFVFVESTDIRFETPAKQRVVIRPRWRNSGNAPTRNACFYSNQKISDDGSAPSEREFHAPDGGIFELGFIGPKGHRDGPGVAFTAEDIDAQQKGLKRLFWWAWTEYDSVFWTQRQRRTEVLYELFVLGDFRNDPDAAYFQAPLGTHNCANGECPTVPRESGGKHRRKHHDQTAALARQTTAFRQAYPPR